jgi:hypothetical protein
MALSIIYSPECFYKHLNPFPLKLTIGSFRMGGLLHEEDQAGTVERGFRGLFERVGYS